MPNDRAAGRAETQKRRQGRLARGAGRLDPPCGEYTDGHAYCQDNYLSADKERSASTSLRLLNACVPASLLRMQHESTRDRHIKAGMALEPTSFPGQ